MLGGEAAPLVWGRAGAYLMRSGQSMFLPEELLVECYVDDPFVLAAGSPATRKKFFAVFLLWMLVLGLLGTTLSLKLGRNEDNSKISRIRQLFR